MTEVQQFLADYAKTGSEAAFREVVSRYLNLVFSTAVRLVNGDSHLAEDVTQRVFADLAKMAGTLGEDAMLGGWLHRHTCFIASKTMRTERRRKAREQQAVQMNLTDHSPENLGAVAPILDDAINNLGTQDRQAILLRYFEQRDLRSVGHALGSNEDAARKRVDRALEKLRGLLKKRGVALSTTALASALGAQAVVAAPAGLATIVTTSALTTVAAGGGTAFTILQIISMTKLQGGIIAAVTIALSIPLVMQHQAKAKLHDENALLRAEIEQFASLREENQRLSNLVAKAKPSSSPSTNNDQFRELMKLRGEVAVLRNKASDAQAEAAASKPTGESALGGMTANPEMSKMIRDQQKLGLGMVYKGFEKRANLPKEKIEELNNLLADEVMTNINHITQVLRDGKSGKELDAVFTKAETETKEKVKELLGPEAFAKYQEYSEQMASYITAEQFKSMLPGEKDAKEGKARQLYELMEEEKKRALAAQGLPYDHQLIPTLNFRNIASEQEAEKSLQLLDGIYEQVYTRAGSFLAPEELEKFMEFRKLAVNNNRIALTLNRKLMAPGATSPR